MNIQVFDIAFKKKSIGLFVPPFSSISISWHYRIYYTKGPTVQQNTKITLFYYF